MIDVARSHMAEIPFHLLSLCLTLHGRLHR